MKQWMGLRWDCLRFQPQNQLLVHHHYQLEMLVADLIAVFLACFSYVQQYLLFVKEKSPGKFSIYITACIIFACIFKIMFFMITPYGVPLFIQNFLLIIICLMITHKFVALGGNKAKDTNNVLTRFWQWPTFAEYLTILTYFTAIIAFVTFQSTLNDWQAVGHVFASCATVLEILIAVPQVLTFYRAKSTKGVSKAMIMIWLCSDLYKTIYFILKHQPLAFIATGTVQFLFDVTLVTQMIIYRERPNKNINDIKVKSNIEQQFIDT